MQRSERWPDESEEERPSRPSSRRNSGSLSRRGSVKKEAEGKKTTSSASSTPKRVPKPPSLDFVVTGKQIAKSRSDRINSLPGAYYRRPSADSIVKPKKFDLTKKFTQASKSRDASVEDDLSLDLSQVSDFEDTNSKYGFKQKFAPLATSSPKRPCQKPRSCSLQNQVLQKEAKKSQKSLDSKSRQSTFSYSTSYKTSASPYRQGVSTDRDCSSVSPEYSAPSSGESAPEAPQDNLISPKSQDFMDSSFCVSWQDCSEAGVRDGEWSHFWANYNNSLARVPVNRYYDQCPTPYRTEDFDLADLEFSTDGSRKRSPENINTINNIICNEGLHLTPRETQNMIKCAHILSNVLTKAIERRTKDDIITEKIEKIQEIDPEKELKKKTMSLDLKETVLPLEVKEEKRWETVTTQTDISLPNTKSAPKIFEKILRQLSKTSIDVPDKEKVAPEKEKKEVTNGEAKEVVNEVKNPIPLIK